MSVHTLRHHERLGLIHPDRRANGYRDYPARMRREVVFIAMSRQLGFSLPQIALRLDEYRAGTLGINDMVQALQERVDAIDQQIAALQSQNPRCRRTRPGCATRCASSRSGRHLRRGKPARAQPPRPPDPGRVCAARQPASPSPRDRTTPSPGDNHHDCSTDTPVQ